MTKIIGGSRKKCQALRSGRKNATKYLFFLNSRGGEMVYAEDLKSSIARFTGSSPVPGTTVRLTNSRFFSRGRHPARSRKTTDLRFEDSATHRQVEAAGHRQGMVRT